jgi:hypothetical protein
VKGGNNMDNNNYNPNYQQPVYPQQPQYDPTKEVMSVGQYIITFILSAIPVVNVICWIVWLASSNTNKNKKNYLIAIIVLWIIGIVISVVAGVLMTAMGVDVLSQM